jgi:DNA (cytosine-5)-methyltransferase 1
MIGSRNGQKFRFPEPTHGDPGELGRDLFDTREPYRTAWDAIGDLSPTEEGLLVGGKWGDLLPSIPEGENYLWHTDRSGGTPLFGWRTRFWSFLLKLSKRLPSWTIQAQPGSAIGPFHWTNRRLTFAELCRLQTFPDGLMVDCGRTEMQRMLGNAVPSLIAEVIAKAIKTQLLGLPDNSCYQLLPPKRMPIPPPEPLRPVLEKYHQFVGVHEAHPGTGRGRSFKKSPENELVTA